MDAGFPVVVIGAGPVGLAAAAQLAERDLPFLVVEAGENAGASVRAWGHVQVFSPWKFNIDPAAARLLTKAGWEPPNEDVLPTGAQLVEQYLAPLAATPQLEPHIRYHARVTALTRDGADRVKTKGRENLPFVVRLASGEEIFARAVIDASGTWTSPNVLGVNGLPAHGEHDAARFIDYGIPNVLGVDRARYAGLHVVVVGFGHSAANTLIALAELAGQAPGTRVTWVIRSGSADRAFGGGHGDRLPARGALGSGIKHLVTTGAVHLVTGFGVHAITTSSEGVVVKGRDGRTIAADRIIAATGFRPDHAIANELRLDLDPILGCTKDLAPLIDPNEHSCGSVRPHGVDELSHPEPGYWAVGMKSYGRAPTFLIATGYEQVRSIADALAGDWDAARRIELNLPETGVCQVTQDLRSATNVTARHGLPPDLPGKLVSATTGHYPTTGTVSAAVRAAATDHTLGAEVAEELAAAAGKQFDIAPDDTTTPPAAVALELAIAPAGGDNCQC